MLVTRPFGLLVFYLAAHEGARSQPWHPRRQGMRRETPISVFSLTVCRRNLTEGVVEVMGELLEAGLDQLLHGGSLVDDTLHDVVNRPYLHRCLALPNLFLRREAKSPQPGCGEKRRHTHFETDLRRG